MAFDEILGDDGSFIRQNPESVWSTVSSFLVFPVVFFLGIVEKVALED